MPRCDEAHPMKGQNTTDEPLDKSKLNFLLGHIRKTIAEKLSMSASATNLNGVTTKSEGIDRMTDMRELTKSRPRSTRSVRNVRKRKRSKKRWNQVGIRGADIDAFFASQKSGESSKQGKESSKKPKPGKRTGRKGKGSKSETVVPVPNDTEGKVSILECPCDSAARVRIYRKRPLLSMCSPDGTSYKPTVFQYNYNWSPDSIARSLRLNKSSTILTVTFSKIAGLGAFATRFIPKHTPIMEYVGELCTQSQADGREAFYDTIPRLSSSCYLFRLDKNTIIDATRYGNAGRFINHSCAPNCVAWKILLPCWNEGTGSGKGNATRSSYSTTHTTTTTFDASNDSIPTDRCSVMKSRPAVVIFAASDIEAGEELCYDYAFTPDNDPSKRLKCYCGAKECRGWMS